MLSKQLNENIKSYLKKAIVNTEDFWDNNSKFISISTCNSFGQIFKLKCSVFIYKYFLKAYRLFKRANQAKLEYGKHIHRVIYLSSQKVLKNLCAYFISFILGERLYFSIDYELVFDSLMEYLFDFTENFLSDKKKKFSNDTFLLQRDLEASLVKKFKSHDFRNMLHKILEPYFLHIDDSKHIDHESKQIFYGEDLWELNPTISQNGVKMLNIMFKK